MTDTRGSDVLVIGGGIAGLSSGAALSRHCKVIVLEAEAAIGFHASGRSATMLHYALGNPLVRALTLSSRCFFDEAPAGFSDVPLGRPMPVLIHAREEELNGLNELDSEIAPFATIERVGEKEMAELCPVLRVGDGGAVEGIVDRNGIRIDPHALLQGFLRTLRSNGGELVVDASCEVVRRTSDRWELETQRAHHFAAPVLVNAAGAWADAVAEKAGVKPLGFAPKRRTIITFDGPKGIDVRGWPFAKTVGDELYFAPESGRLFASPMDEVATDPCDAQPDDYEVALAAHRIEDRTTLSVERIVHKWAGLRTFAPDGNPVAGFDADAPGFFWLAGQGGFGLQTAPVMADIAASLIAGAPWPIESVTVRELGSMRLTSRSVQGQS